MERKTIEEGITAGPQPDREAMERLPREGFRTIVDVRDEATNGLLLPPREEAEQAERGGLRYIQIPLDWKHLNYDDADRFRAAIQEAERPVYVHSRRGDLAAALVIMDRAIEKGIEPMLAVRQAEQMGVIRAGTRADDFMAAYVAAREGSRL